MELILFYLIGKNDIIRVTSTGSNVAKLGDNFEIKSGMCSDKKLQVK